MDWFQRVVLKNKQMDFRSFDFNLAKSKITTFPWFRVHVNVSMFCFFHSFWKTLYSSHCLHHISLKNAMKWRRHRIFYFTFYPYEIYDWDSILKCSFFQDDHKAFRRQLEDKRPIVESNLLSGKQYIASEPAVSDTSDSEGKHYLCYKILLLI